MKPMNKCDANPAGRRQKNGPDNVLVRNPCPHRKRCHEPQDRQHAVDDSRQRGTNRAWSHAGHASREQGQGHTTS